MDIRKVDVKKLNPARYNPRKDLQQEDAAYKKLENSISEFGYITPIVWNERTGNVVGGHQRLKVLIESGISEISVSVVNMDEEKEKALNIALNKISGEWDGELLIKIVDGLSAEKIGLTGLNEYEIKLLREEANIELDLDDFFNEVETPKSKNEKKGRVCKCEECGCEFEV